jgi:hypothetical protein
VPASPLHLVQLVSAVASPVMAVPQKQEIEPAAAVFTSPKKFCPPRAMQSVAHCLAAGLAAEFGSDEPEYPVWPVSRPYVPVREIPMREVCAKHPVCHVSQLSLLIDLE